jgi:hypothetical protein
VLLVLVDQLHQPRVVAEVAGLRCFRYRITSKCAGKLGQLT